MLDLDEITEDIGLGRFQLLQQLLVSGVRLADGAEILISSAVLSILQQDWELSPALKGGMMSVIFIGVFFGNLIGGPAADTYGRRVSVLMAYFGLVICGFSSAASTGPTSMLLARFFFGLCYGFGMGPSLTLQAQGHTSTTTCASERLHIPKQLRRTSAGGDLSKSMAWAHGERQQFLLHFG
ncbi:Gallate transporter (Gallate permease) [Durusdinium trenchii]|uniref:Gallate transporter (Gallate permease) n=1 Tax=Durusdinium trenchii TaxID=1381693 RepID=A0ABP0HLK1_9DINO